MGTLVCFHAHPDDETLTTGGTMARAAATGHRVVLVIATDGRHGESPDDLRPGESLVERRLAETQRSADALGVTTIHWLGYHDSGMQGWEQNADPLAFVQADTEEVAARLADILRREAADVLTTYDWHGNYGHPDHIKAHHVGHRAAELAGTPNVYEATMNRDSARLLMEAAKAAGALEGQPTEVEEISDDGNPLGMPEAELTTEVDVRDYIGRKRASFEAHASQVTDTSFFLQMPDDLFLMGFGREWFIRKGASPGIHEHWLAGLD